MLTHELFHSLHQLSRHLTNKLNDALKPYGLYSAQWAVIFTLQTKGSLTQKQLCDYLFVEAPPMTRTIQRLVKQGYVNQVRGQDKREKYIELTDEAKRLYPEWEQTVNNQNQSLLLNFSAESQQELLKLQRDWLHELTTRGTSYE